MLDKEKLYTFLSGFTLSLFGEFNGTFMTLIIFMVTDFIFGVILACRGKSSKSENGHLSGNVAIDGLIKKCAILASILVSHRIGLEFNTPLLRTGVIYSFVLGEGISILESVKQLGIRLPKKLLKALEGGEKEIEGK